MTGAAINHLMHACQWETGLFVFKFAWILQLFPRNGSVASLTVPLQLAVWALTVLLLSKSSYKK